MGAGASVQDAPTNNSAGASGKTAGTPQLLTEKSHKLIQNTLSYYDVENYLSREFAKADVNQDTSLDYPEFIKLVKGLNLNMKDDEILALQRSIDDNKDGRIVLAEVLAKSADLLKKMYSSIPPGPLDWCKMYDEQGLSFYYNKRSGATSWEEPEGFISLEQQLIDKTKDVKTLVSWMKEQFESSDADCNAMLSPAEFALFLRSLKLQITDADIEQIMTETDTDGDGQIHWMEAVQRMPLILNNIYSMLPPGPHDWCPLADKDGSVYYYNKRTGETQWETPEDYVEALP